MTDREEREEHIKRLEAVLACEEKQSSGKCSKQTCDDNCALLYEQGNWGEWKETLRYAINSLKIDLKYDLLYEETSGQADKQTAKKDLAVDYRSLEDIKKLIERKADDLDGVMLDAGGVIIGLYFAIANDLPSVTPQFSSGLEKNSKKLEKDFGESDCISRKAVQTRLKEIIHEMETIFADIREREVDDSVCGLCEYDCDHGLDGFANECPGFEKDDCFKLNEKHKAEWLDISNLPPVTPQEPKTGHWIEEFNDLEGEVRFTCSSCGEYQLFGTDFCYHCGSDNREVEE